MVRSGCRRLLGAWRLWTAARCHWRRRPQRPSPALLLPLGLVTLWEELVIILPPWSPSQTPPHRMALALRVLTMFVPLFLRTLLLHAAPPAGLVRWMLLLQAALQAALALRRDRVRRCPMAARKPL